jgi:hypothetical protein
MDHLRQGHNASISLSISQADIGQHIDAVLQLTELPQMSTVE